MIKTTRKLDIFIQIYPVEFVVFINNPIHMGQRLFKHFLNEFFHSQSVHKSVLISLEVLGFHLSCTSFSRNFSVFRVFFTGTSYHHEQPNSLLFLFPSLSIFCHHFFHLIFHVVISKIRRLLQSLQDQDINILIQYGFTLVVFDW